MTKFSELYLKKIPFLFVIINDGIVDGVIGGVCDRLPSHDTGVSSGKTDQGHPAYILTRQFSTTVSPVSRIVLTFVLHREPITCLCRWVRFFCRFCVLDGNFNGP